MTQQLVQVEVPVPGLHASAAEAMPFGRDLVMRAFLLERERGNVLVYGVPSVGAGDAWLAGLGGAGRQYLTHSHEAMFLPAAPAAPLFVHDLDREPVARTHEVRGGFSRRHALDGDLEVIPIPGHTPGATALLWQAGDHRVLFSGDSVYLDGDEWVAAVLGSSDRRAYLASLELLGGLDFDVLVPWVATRGRPGHALVGRDEARRRIAAIAERLRRGERR